MCEYKFMCVCGSPYRWTYVLLHYFGIYFNVARSVNRENVLMPIKYVTLVQVININVLIT